MDSEANVDEMEMAMNNRCPEEKQEGEGELTRVNTQKRKKERR